MRLPIPIGVDDFREMRERKLEYIDKTHLIRDLLDLVETKVFLFPRPRRFGKSLNLSMLRYFFERGEEDRSHLFEGLTIWKKKDEYRSHFQRYPVIYMTFKDVKFETFDQAWEVIRAKVRTLFHEHLAVLDGGRLDEWQIRKYREVLDNTASNASYYTALADLSFVLHTCYGREVVILIDEYDAPIHAAYAHGYTRPILDFFRAFLTGGLKDNPHLFKAVLTGILRVARESVFSGLNNLAVYSLLRPEFSDAFGFTEPEVEALLERADASEHMPVVRAWYNGYLFGGTVIYNPWSVLNFIQQHEKEPQPFWLTTSSNDLIKDLLQKRATTLEPAIEALLQGDAVERVLDENVVLDQLSASDDAFFSLLVFSGYLKAEKRSRGPMERPAHLLSIPNREVRELYTGTFRDWMRARMSGHGASIDRLTSAMLRGDTETFEEQLQAFATNLLSYCDTGAVDPEVLYHGFTVGLLAVLEPGFQVRSNRESGSGRPDVWVRPIEAGKPGVVLELKVARPRRKPLVLALDRALEEGLEQIRQNDYTAELRAANASPIYAYAVAFDGKTVRVASA